MTVLTHRPRWRPAFTLIELIVVMAIIGILLSLTAGAVWRIMGNQQEANTKTFLRSINSNLKKQWSDVYDAALRQGAIPAAIQSTILTNAGNNPERARVIYAKLMLQQAFPMTFKEALTGPALVGPYNGYVKYLNGLGITAANVGNTPTAWESSACLLMAMQMGPKHIGVRIEDFGAGAVGGETYSTGAQVRYFKDGWGNPFFFCRWPTAAEKLNPGGNPQNGLHDTADPKGLLDASDWALPNVAGFTWFKNNIHNLPTRGAQATSYTLTPLLVSSGPDGKLGMSLDPTQGGQTATASDITDNLYNVDVQ